MSETAHRCGYVAIVGRPNVGKSTLLNRILGQKISITSSKPQTTRHRILGIKTEADYQAVYVDTPGLHTGARAAINRYMNRAASQVLHEVDVIVFMIDAQRWTDEDEAVLKRIREVSVPVILAINKVDRLEDRAALLPTIEACAERYAFADIVPLCAKNGDNLAALETCVARLLPESEPFFPEDQVTDRSQRFLAAELVREKLFRLLGQELPYATTVEIESFKPKDGVLHIHAVIWVARPGQKAIVIGKQGSVLKEVGRKARIDMEKMFDSKVFLQLWVKVKEGWADDERALRSFGYTDEP